MIAFGVVALILGLTYVFIEPVRVAGGSMYPALRSGDVVFVRRGAAPRPGEVVLIDLRGHGPVLHRAVEREASGLWRTKGDANPIEDAEPASETDIRGRVVAVLPVGSILERWQQ
jgi:signal peptidase I